MQSGCGVRHTDKVLDVAARKRCGVGDRVACVFFQAAPEDRCFRFASANLVAGRRGLSSKWAARGGVGSKGFASVKPRWPMLLVQVLDSVLLLGASRVLVRC